MNKVRLTIRGVSEIVGTEEIGLIVLVDETLSRQLTIPCDKQMLSQFRLRIGKVPVVGRMLPEVLWHVICTQTDLHFEIIINDLIDGQYRALLYNTETLEPVSMRASDAALLSYISHIPLFVERGLMEKQSVDFYEKAKGLSIPVNTISDEMLQSALDKAIKDENYEMASHLRDEINRRKTRK
ncbi:MAG: bifunctional nuclease family protein [Prevotella sp.]|nr:bifunctional nuclease family protein [Prevotella sp.]